MDITQKEIQSAIKILEAELEMREIVFAKRDPKLLSEKVTEMVLVINLLKRIEQEKFSLFSNVSLGD